MTVSLRPPSPSDYEALASWIPDQAACLRWAGPKVRFPFTAAELPDLLLPGGASYCLAKGSEVALGFGQYSPRPDNEVHLLRIIVAPASRGEGLGRELCRQLVARALSDTSASAVTLSVYRDNTRAIALYESLGFDVVEARSSTEALLMAKPAV